jgi:hypothetical protein
MSRALEPRSIDRLIALMSILDFLSGMKELEGASVILSTEDGDGGSMGRIVAGAKTTVRVKISVEVTE